MLDAMQIRSVQLDEDCPELTDEQIVKWQYATKEKEEYMLLQKAITAGSLTEV